MLMAIVTGFMHRTWRVAIAAVAYWSIRSARAHRVRTERQAVYCKAADIGPDRRNGWSQAAWPRILTANVHLRRRMPAVSGDRR